MFNQIYQSFKASFNKSRLEFLFQRTSLGMLLSQDNNPSPWEFFNTYFSSWWYNQLLFGDFALPKIFDPFDAIVHSLTCLERQGLFNEENTLIVANHANPCGLARALSHLLELGILNQGNFNLVVIHLNPYQLADVLYDLALDKILKENEDIIINHADPRYLADAICDLRLAGILNQANLDATLANPKDLARALFSLQGARILTQENFTIVANHANPRYLAYALTSLKGAGILTQENFTIVANHANPDDLAHALRFLKDARILTQENFTIVANHTNPGGLARALEILHYARTLTQENFTIVANHANPRYLADALCDLRRVGILTQDNRNVVANHANPHGLGYALKLLKDVRILTQENFNALVHPAHAPLLTEEALQHVWSYIPGDGLTQANFTRLLVASERPNPIQELQRVTADIIGLVDVEARPAQVFNDGQSTHTTSVHRSVSESATKLMNSYGASLALETKIQEIKAYVNGLDNSPKHLAAKRCIARIAAPDYAFNDSSKVSTRQLLAIAFTAIHDDTKRIGTLEDAKALFIQALYEIQRGYNLNEQGIDDGQPDRSICTAGTFNKIMEKLNGIHTDVEIYFITPQGANLKYPKLAEVYALQYLRSIASPDTAEDYQQCKAILDRMQQDDSLEPIWDNIKDGVARDLWDEFKLAYGENPKDRRFLYLINDAWQDLQAPSVLPEIETKLLASPGYQQLIGLQMRDLFNSSQSPLMARLHEHSLWANRHASPAAQNDFDKRYGLAIIPSK